MSFFRNALTDFSVRLFSQLQLGSLSFDRLQPGIEDCTKQNFAYSVNSSIIPDQPLQHGQELRYA